MFIRCRNLLPQKYSFTLQFYYLKHFEKSTTSRVELCTLNDVLKSLIEYYPDKLTDRKMIQSNYFPYAHQQVHLVRILFSN